MKNLLVTTMEKLEKLSRRLVSMQIVIEEMKNELEEEYGYKSADPVESELTFYPGPPKKLKIVVPFFPPKIQVAANLVGKSYMRYVFDEVQDIWNATIEKLYHDNKDKHAELDSFGKTIIWVTYFFPNKMNYNVNNLSIKVIIYALSNYFLYSARDNRAYTLILDGQTDRNKPRTEIVIIEDYGQLDELKSK